jgi:Protein of unknown function (DUF2911)
MKRLLTSAAVALSVAGLTLIAPVAAHAQQALKLPRVSPKATVTQTVGLTDVTITFSRPGVKGRTIWGDLVPYDKVWRTGANEATTFQVSQDVKINGQALPAGTYSLHTIPGKTQWTVIFNKTADQWGSYEYDQTKDALRVQVTPQQGPSQELMAFSFPDVQNDKATVELAWEKVRVPFTLETGTNDQALANIRQALSGDVKEWNVPYSAAQYAVTAKLSNQAEAMKWIDQSIALKPTYWNMRLKAQMLDQQGNKKDAVAAAEKAVALGKEAKDEPSEVAKTEKQIAEWKAAIK